MARFYVLTGKPFHNVRNFIDCNAFSKLKKIYLDSSGLAIIVCVFYLYKAAIF